MTEQEKKSGGTTESSVVLVEQSATSRHKHPFRPVDMQEDAPKELHHKRSKAPAVPSVTEELKDSIYTESKGKIECERAMSSEKHKHVVAKKLSSVTKRRASSPEGITLAPMMADMKKESKVSSQPIPAPVPQPPEKVQDQPAKHDERKDDEDSISEDVAELRTPEVDKAPSEWIENIASSRKKEVSWNDDEYLSKVKLEATYEDAPKSCMLEKKASLGPCFHVAAPFGRPSGISICLAKRCANPEVDSNKPAKSMINISLSRRCLVNKTIYREPYTSITQKKRTTPKLDAVHAQVRDAPKGNFLGTLKEKISTLGDKIKNSFV